MELFSSYLAYLVKPKHFFPGWLIVAVSGVFAGFSFGFFLQTELYMSLKTGPDRQWILSEIKKSEDKADKLRKRASATLPPEPFIDFDEDLKGQLKDARAFVENDEEFQKLLLKRFGRNFKGLDVIMIPMWSPKVQDNYSQAGITYDARWTDVLDAFFDKDAKAVTIRERPGKPQMTVDGIPRIIVKYEAFASTTTLRKTVFHELLHAINLPGYRYRTKVPWWGEVEYTKAQDDLCYLEEYRNYTSKESLWLVEDCTPGAGFIAFALFSVGGIIYLLVRSKFGW